MDELRDRFDRLNLLPVPDIWGDVERRRQAMGSTARTTPVVDGTTAWQAGRDRQPGERGRWLDRRHRATLLLAFVLAAAVILAAALAVGSGLVRRTSLVPPGPSAAIVASPVPGPSATSAASPAASPVPSSASPAVGKAATPRMLADLIDYRVATDGVGWAATRSGLYRTQDDSQTWTQVRPNGSNQLNAPALVDARTAYVPAAVLGTIDVTHDGGATWTEARLDIPKNVGGPILSFQDASTAFATYFSLTEHGPMAIYSTTDGGTTWTGPVAQKVPHLAASFDKVLPPIGGFLWQSAGKGDNKPFDNRFFLSSDGGANWTQYTFPIGNLAPRNALKMIGSLFREDDGRILMALDVDGGRNPIPGAIYESGADPASWRLVATLPSEADGIEFLSATEWVLVSTPFSEVRSTVDRGAHWRISKSSLDFNGVFTHHFGTTESGWVTKLCSLVPDSNCGPSGRGSVLFSTSDGGVTWSRIGG
ncbi:MAG: WD40/YVTN/BNR-like repeat-containing protein [Chloroflexota bacterium]